MTAPKKCRYHGSDLINGKCPACVVERDGWDKCVTGEAKCNRKSK